MVISSTVALMSRIMSGKGRAAKMASDKLFPSIDLDILVIGLVGLVFVN